MVIEGRCEYAIKQPETRELAVEWLKRRLARELHRKHFARHVRFTERDSVCRFGLRWTVIVRAEAAS